MQVTGEIVNIIFRNEDTGYTVIDLKCGGGEVITAVGIFPPVSEGEGVTIVGDYKSKTKFGNQLVAEKVTVSAPNRLDSIARFLASGLIKGLGKVTAAAIVDRFGLESLEKMKYPFELKKVKGISLQKATEFGLQYTKILNMQSAVIFLQDLGLTIKTALKIYKVFGEKTRDTITKNPYLLIESIDGIGFNTADKIAGKIGISHDSDKRISAGIIYLLKEAAQRGGDTYLPEDELMKSAAELLQLSEDAERRILDNIDDMTLLGQLKRIAAKEHTAVMLLYNYFNEKMIAQRLADLSARASKLRLSDGGEEIALFEKEEGITLHISQKEAVYNALNNGVAVITGGPGTGKTTIIKCILSAFKNLNQRVVLCAPTGRAAKRLSETTKEEAKTIHRLLDLDWKDGDGYFLYNENEKLPLDVVIVDEVSMVDEYVFVSLLKAMQNGTRLILVGDKDQLPSVGAGNILSDIIQSNKFSVSFLTQIYRQSENSAIVLSAHLINSGKTPDLSNKYADFFYEEKEGGEEIKNSVLALCTKRLPEYLSVKPKDIQLLSPMRRGLAGVDNLNREMQRILNPYSRSKNELKYGDSVFRVGDKVMQTVNNYKQEWTAENHGRIERGLGVFNGDMGYIVDINLQNQKFTVRFDDDKIAEYATTDLEQLTLAYAVTIHKSQGCEFDIVVLALDANYLLLTRNLLYTAVTRAKKFVILVGAKKTVYLMVHNNKTKKRMTLLKQFIEEEFEKQADFGA